MRSFKIVYSIRISCNYAYMAFLLFLSLVNMLICGPVFDVARDTENEDQHVDSTNTRVVLPQPPNCNPKATEFEVKI
ncbi:hypothetical protein Hanom_Chr08g00694461 [Helianthus anomalus]